MIEVRASSLSSSSSGERQFVFNVIAAKLDTYKPDFEENNAAVLYMTKELVRKIGQTLGYNLVEEDTRGIVQPKGFTKIKGNVDFAPSQPVEKASSGIARDCLRDAPFAMDDDLDVQWSE